MTAATLVVIGAFPPPINGQSKNLRIITDALVARQGARVVEATVAAGALTKSPVTHARKFARVLNALRVLRREARGDGPRTLYLTADGGKGLYYTRMFARTALRLGYRLILQHRTFLYSNTHRPLMKEIDALVAKGGYHVFLCRTMAEKFRALYGETADYRVIEDHSLYTDFLPEPAPGTKPAPRPRIGILSNLYKVKGIDTFLDAALICLDEGLDVEFAVGGPVPDAEIDALIDAAVARYPDRIAKLGPQYGEDKLAFFTSLDLFVFPTRYPFEAQPNVVIEAMAAGAVVVAPDRGCIAGDIAGSGITIPADRESDPAAYAEAIRALVTDRDDLARRQAASAAQMRGAVAAAKAAYERFLDDATAADRQGEAAG